jgi:hypothetical protein
MTVGFHLESFVFSSISILTREPGVVRVKYMNDTNQIDTKVASFLIKSNGERVNYHYKPYIDKVDELLLGDTVRFPKDLIPAGITVFYTDEAADLGFDYNREASRLLSCPVYGNIFVVIGENQVLCYRD